MIGLSITVLAAAMSTPAEPTSGRLDWQAPAECPSGAAVRAQLDQLAGGDVDFDVRGQIEPTEAGYRLTLSLDRTQARTREAESPDCALLARAAALIIALDVDPITAAERNLAATTPPPVQRPSSPLEAPPRIPPAEDRVSQPSDRPRSSSPASPPAPRWSHGFEAALGVGVSVLTTPNSTAGLEAMAGWTYGSLRLRLLGEHWIRSRRTLEPGAGIRAALSGAVPPSTRQIRAARRRTSDALGGQRCNGRHEHEPAAAPNRLCPRLRRHLHVRLDRL